MREFTRHEASTELTPFGHVGKCSCGGVTIGFFTSAAAAKRAILNISHPEDRGKDASK